MTRQRFRKQPGTPLPMRSMALLKTTVACVALVLLLLVLISQLLRKRKKKGLPKGVSGGPFQCSDYTQFYYDCYYKYRRRDFSTPAGPLKSACRRA